MLKEPISLWAKIRRQDPADAASAIVAWHPLVDHCADVCACFEALLALPGYRRRAEHLLGSPLCATRAARLALLAFLHDIGKGNAGFQSKVFPLAERHPSAPRGHLREAAELLTNQALLRRAVPALHLDAIEDWFVEEGEDDAGGIRMLLAAWSHHGLPLEVEVGASHQPASGAWEIWRWASPEATLALFAGEIAAHHATAFRPAEPMRATPRFQAFFAGLLTLADWIGSSDHEDRFPFSQEGDGPRLPWARARARAVIAAMGLDAEWHRAALIGRPDSYAAVFGLTAPNAMQRSVATLPLPGLPL